ncbi:MAG: thiolase family protein, partial [Bdellovibrionales bacterium]|nr:thiolase family protein [Bdellovibrionales bacterium]
MSLPVYIVSAKRTPIGRFQGVFSHIPASELGAVVLSNLLKDQSIPLEKVGECLVGQVLTAGVGQAPARQTAIRGGLSSSTPCVTVNKVCGSGLKAIMMACDSIELKRAEVVVAGGQENMSLAPHILPGSRKGMSLGSAALQDTLLEDGLLNPYDNRHMGVIGEVCAEKYGISREEQDEFAKGSYEKALQAQKKGWFKDEIVPVPVKEKAKEINILEDEEPARARFEKMARLPTIFKKNGTITPANASK